MAAALGMLIFPQNIYLGHDRLISLVTNRCNFTGVLPEKREMLAKQMKPEQNHILWQIHGGSKIIWPPKMLTLANNSSQGYNSPQPTSDLP